MCLFSDDLYALWDLESPTHFDGFGYGLGNVLPLADLLVQIAALACGSGVGGSALSNRTFDRAKGGFRTRHDLVLCHVAYLVIQPTRVWWL